MTRLGIVLVFLGCLAVRAQLTWVPDDAMQLVFAGQSQRFQAVFSNATSQSVSVTIHARLSQASSATTIVLQNASINPFPIGPGQTVIESVVLTIPRVKAATRFLLQWADDRNRVLGTTDIMGYPDDLLQPLKSLAGNEPLTVYDPQRQLMPLLKKANVEFADLADENRDGSTAKLALIMPSGPKESAPAWLADKMVAWAKAGTAVVWIEPPSANLPAIEPSAYPVRLGAGTVVVAQARTVANLAEKPLSQLNLVRLAEWATNPNAFGPPPIKP